ncbi:MFS transporter, partial [Bacillus subtilis]|uniref:MFS transporter n=1 Tax=Bacillus subtilis TaxID=1423 RepID=UPI0024ACBB2C
TRDPKTIDAEIRSMKGIKTKERVSISTILSPAIRPILFIGIGVALFQQVIGTNTIIYDTQTILENAGFGAASAIAGPIG